MKTVYAIAAICMACLLCADADAGCRRGRRGGCSSGSCGQSQAYGCGNASCPCGPACACTNCACDPQSTAPTVATTASGRRIEFATSADGNLQFFRELPREGAACPAPTMAQQIAACDAPKAVAPCPQAQCANGQCSGGDCANGQCGNQQYVGRRGFFGRRR